MAKKFRETQWKHTLTSRKGELLFRHETDSNADLVVAIGVVDKIVKGDEFDLVSAHFGIKYHSYQRTFVVAKKTARKQLVLLKKNNYAFFIGYCKKINGQLVFYATGLQAFTTPKAIDVRKGLLGLDEELILEGNKESSKKEYNEMEALLEALKND